MLIKCYTREIQPLKCTENNFTRLEPMTAAGVSLKGPFHPGVQKIPTDISLVSVLLGTGTTMLVHITTE